MQTLPPAPLAALLRSNAKGVYSVEAAVELLIANDHWLHSRDFTRSCVHVQPHHDAAGQLVLDPALAAQDGGPPAAWIDWETVPALLEHTAFSGSEGRILRLAAELAGVDSGIPLADLLVSLDGRNSALVVAAITHALHIGPPVDWAALGGTR